MAFCLGGCEAPPSYVTLHGETMGTSYQVRYRVLPEGPPEARVEAAVADTLAAVNRVLSTWDPDSELSRLNRAPGPGPFPSSAMLEEVLRAAQAIHAASGGAFDPSVGPLVDLWGFGPSDELDRQRQLPAADRIAETRRAVGFERVRLTADGVVRPPPPFRLDVSALGKGYGVDRVFAALIALGLADVVVEIGGEVRVAGRGPRGPWQVGIEAPIAHRRELAAVVPLADGAMASSGDYRNGFEVDGRRYSHLIDPRTGWPVARRNVVVSVWAPSAMVADAWATALAVLGPEWLDTASLGSGPLQPRAVRFQWGEKEREVLTFGPWPTGDGRR